MISIESGPALERAVGEALGWKRPGFRPAIDVNDALLAAAHVWKRFSLTRLASGKYEVTAFCDGDDGWSRFEAQATPALAICAAILFSKEGKGDE
jgi:hypothetical protein